MINLLVGFLCLAIAVWMAMMAVAAKSDSAHLLFALLALANVVLGAANLAVGLGEAT